MTGEVKQMTLLKGQTHCPITKMAVYQSEAWSDFRGAEGYVGNFYKVGNSVFVSKGCGALDQLDDKYFEMCESFVTSAFSSFPVIEVHMMDEVTGLFSAQFRRSLQQYFEKNRAKIRAVIWTAASGPIDTVIQTLNWIAAPMVSSLSADSYEVAITMASELLASVDSESPEDTDVQEPVIQISRDRMQEFIDFAGRVVWNNESPDFETVAGFSDDTHLCVLSNLFAIEVEDFKRQLSERDQAIANLRQELMEAMEKKAMAEAVAKEMRGRLVHLEAKAEEARNAGYTKSYFYKELSRKIRTPLNGISGMNALLAETELTDEQRDCIDISSSCADSLMSLIDDALNFIQLESEDYMSVTTTFNLFALISDLSQKYLGNSQRRDIDFACTVDPRVTAFYVGDVEKIAQIVETFIESALGRPGVSEINVNVEMDTDKSDSSVLRFAICDDGKQVSGSVDREFTDVVGDVQWPLDISDKHLGMRLSIVKKLVGHMDGQVGVMHKTNFANEFWFQLELPKSTTAGKGSSNQAMFHNRRVLVAHDASRPQAYLDRLMKSWGMRSIAVSDKTRVFDLMKEGVHQNDPFELLVLDCHQSDQFGEKMGTLIKTEPDFADTRMMMISRTEDTRKSSYVRNMGFDAFLVKPFKQNDLRECLQTVLSDDDVPWLVTKTSIYEKRRGKYRILVVEDNPVNQTVALGIIKKLGFMACAVNSGKEALIEMKRHVYDLVFMDVIMPDMNGYRTTELIRSAAGEIQNPDVPIIALTATALRGDREKCLRAGMNDYLPKPIEPKKLSRILDRYLINRSTSPQ